MCEVALEEFALFVQRPRAQHAAQQVRRRIGDEAFRSQHRRQHVASSAAADQDLAAAVLGAFDERDSRAARGCECGRDQTRGARTDDGHRRRRH